MRDKGPSGENRRCNFCGASFRPNRSWQRFCSGSACRNGWRARLLRKRRRQAKDNQVKEAS